MVRCPQSICAVASAHTRATSLFNNLTKDCHPIATKSRKFSECDKKLIRNEIEKLLKDGVIEPSSSPWRSQVLVTPTGRHKKRLVVDYSRTINKFTLLDAYPLPRIDNIVNDLANYNIFSTFDLKSAYYQIPIAEDDKPYTAFEADGKLYQFCSAVWAH